MLLASHTHIAKKGLNIVIPFRNHLWFLFGSHLPKHDHRNIKILQTVELVNSKERYKHALEMVTKRDFSIPNWSIIFKLKISNSAILARFDKTSKKYLFFTSF